MIEFKGKEWVRIPRKSFYGKTLVREYANLVEFTIRNNAGIIDYGVSILSPGLTKRTLYLTDEELILFKLSNFLDDAEMIVGEGFTYNIGI